MRSSNGLPDWHCRNGFRWPSHAESIEARTIEVRSIEAFNAVADKRSTPVHDKQAEVMTMNAMNKDAKKEVPEEPVKPAEEPPALKATPLLAQPDVLGGSLVVQIKTSYPWRDQMPSSIDDEVADPKAYEEPVEVTVELTAPDDGFSTFGDSKYTVKGGDGEVSWDQVPPGGYTITVTTSEGFALASYSMNACEKGAGDRIDIGPNQPPLITPAKVCDEEVTTVEVFLLPLLSAVDVLPFYDKDRSGDPDCQTPISGLRASFRAQGKPVVALRLSDFAKLKDEKEQPAIKELLGPSLTQTLQSHPDYSRVYLLWKAGTVSVFTDPTVRVTPAGQNTTLALQSDTADGTFVYLERGSLVAAHIAYEESQAEIQVSAFLEEDFGCDPCCPPAGGRKATKKTALPNVTFRLYQGAPQGEPYREATTAGSAPHCFSSLPAGNYTIVASSWPTTFGGRSQLQPRWPAGGVLRPFSLSAGRPAKLEFSFAPCLSKVTGIVTDGQAGAGVPGVPLTLASSGNSGSNKASTYSTTSDASGEYEFTDITPGSYVVRIEREKIFQAGGKTLEVPAAAQAGYALNVPECGTVSAPVFQLDDDIHKVFGTATAPDGSVLQFLRVEIQDKSGNVLAVTQTDQNGYYEVLLPQSGSFLVVPQVNDAPQIPVQVNSQVQLDILASPSGGSGAGKAAAKKSAQVIESEIDLQAYPVLTEEVPTDVVQRPSGGGGGGSGSNAPIGKLAENAIRDVLSWRTKANDPKSFVMALNQSFKLTETEGHTDFTWTPRSYTVQTDMGAITGAQASIYTRAKVALDQSMPLLDGLYLTSAFTRARGHGFQA